MNLTIYKYPEGFFIEVQTSVGISLVTDEIYSKHLRYGNLYGFYWACSLL